jgi:hypothetical protein
LLINIPSNYLIHSLESFVLETELSDCIKEEIFKRLSIDNDNSKISEVYNFLMKKYNIVQDDGSNQACNAIQEFNNLIKQS